MVFIKSKMTVCAIGWYGPASRLTHRLGQRISAQRAEDGGLWKMPVQYVCSICNQLQPWIFGWKNVNYNSGSMRQTNTMHTIIVVCRYNFVVRFVLLHDVIPQRQLPFLYSQTAPLGASHLSRPQLTLPGSKVTQQSTWEVWTASTERLWLASKLGSRFNTPLLLSGHRIRHSSVSAYWLDLLNLYLQKGGWQSHKLDNACHLKLKVVHVSKIRHHGWLTVLYHVQRKCWVRI